MDHNKLTSVDQAVFQSLLNCFKKNNISAAISLANSTSRLFLIHLTAYYYIMQLHLLICFFYQNRSTGLQSSFLLQDVWMD